jgi:hypothetical protein
MDGVGVGVGEGEGEGVDNNARTTLPYALAGHHDA